jgi:hypothetical protein
MTSPVQKIAQQTAKTLAWSTLGTAAIVALHHRYRRQSTNAARLADYPAGLKSELLKLSRAGQIGTQAFIKAYQDSGFALALTSQDLTKADHLKVGRQSETAVATVKWVSGVAALVEGGYGVVGVDSERQIVWQTPMSERVHDIVVQPAADDSNVITDANIGATTAATKAREVVVMGRRPSERFWVLDTTNGDLRHAITAQSDRHFYGHACFSLDGDYLYVTENDTVSLAGKIGVYDARQGYQKVKEFDSHGIGPHELVMHPDGETLVIANGGIKTEKASRDELNLDSMRPSLAYLNRHDGTLLEQVVPQHPQMSVRHLDIHRDGTVMIGIQFQGPKHINVPLVLTHQRGDTDFTPLQMPQDQWQCFHQYIASVAVDAEHNLLCVTTPIGGCAAVYDLATRQLIDVVTLPDCAGASVIKAAAADAKQAGFIVSDGQGSITALTLHRQTTASRKIIEETLDSVIDNSWQVSVTAVYHKMSFDNHLQAL